MRKNHICNIPGYNGRGWMGDEISSTTYAGGVIQVNHGHCYINTDDGEKEVNCTNFYHLTAEGSRRDRGAMLPDLRVEGHLIVNNPVWSYWTTLLQLAPDTFKEYMADFVKQIIDNATVAEKARMRNVLGLDITTLGEWV